MSDVFANMPPKILQCILVVFTPSSTDGERTNALHIVDRYLGEAGSDQHDLVERIKAPPQSQLSEAIKGKLTEAFNAGVIKGRTEEIEKRQRAVSVIASLGGFDPGGHNGFSWAEIAGHCMTNKHRIRNHWEADVFLPSIAERLANPTYKISQKEAPILRRIFEQWFAGQIT